MFNRLRPEHYNLLATIAEDQLSIYDNANCGEHLDLMLHFVNTPLPGAFKREVRIRAWWPLTSARVGVAIFSLWRG